MSLTVVGLGITLGKHVSERTLSEIKAAEQVFALVDGMALAWLKRFRPDVISLHPLYGNGDKSRRDAYQQMSQQLVAAAQSSRVCAVLYGHPGVFADVAHMAIGQLREQGIAAQMEPGVSADACLYADLGIDPGKHGLISMEATHFLLFQRQLDPSMLVLLWQLGVTGDLRFTDPGTNRARLALLAEKLALYYPKTTPMLLYEAAQLAIQPMRAEAITLAQLANAATSQITTLVIPPQAPRRDRYWQQRLEALQHH